MDIQLEFWVLFIAGLVVPGMLYFFMRSKVISWKERYEELKITADELNLKAEKLGYEKSQLFESRVRLEEQNQQLNERLLEQQQNKTEEKENLKREFQQMASEILEKNAGKLQSEHQFRLSQVLNPLKENIERFEKRINETHEWRSKQDAALGEQIKLLNQNSIELQDEARHLTKALKGDTKTQGNWGEVVLERILESSGLQEGSEFVLQGSEMKLKSESGKALKPDVIINLPDEKHLVIDAKVSLKAYEQLLNNDDEGNTALLEKSHLQSVKKHIDELSGKYYQEVEALNSPDFVFLFLPIEASLSIALKLDRFLFEYAWKRKIVLVTPTTLLASLKTVASIWKIERQNKNAMEIARMGELIQKQVHSFVLEMEKIDKGLQQAGSAYTSAMRKLSDGQQSILRRSEKLADLGIESKDDSKRKIGR